MGENRHNNGSEREGSPEQRENSFLQLQEDQEAEELPNKKANLQLHPTGAIDPNQEILQTEPSKVFEPPPGQKNISKQKFEGTELKPVQVQRVQQKNE